MLIWRPTPILPEIDGNTPVPVPRFEFSLSRHFAGPVHFGRVAVGAFVIVVGVVWSKAIMEFLLRASNGTLTISSQLQAQLVSMEVAALVALVEGVEIDADARASRLSGQRGDGSCLAARCHRAGQRQALG